MAAERPALFSRLRYFLVGGDRVNPAYIEEIRKKYRDLKILHMYGPTENTTFSTFLAVDSGNLSYNIPHFAVLEGELEQEKLEKVFEKLIAFLSVAGKPAQRIHHHVQFEIEHHASKTEEIIETFVRPFHLAKAPLMRLGLLKTGPLEHQ